MPVFHFLYFRHMRLLYFQKFTVYKIAQIQGAFSPVPTTSNLLRPCLAARLPQPSFPPTTSCSLPLWIFPSRIPKGAFLWWRLILQPRPWVHPSGPLRSLSNCPPALEPSWRSWPFSSITVSLPHLTTALYRVCPSSPHQVVAGPGFCLCRAVEGRPQPESGAHPALPPDRHSQNWSPAYL